MLATILKKHCWIGLLVVDFMPFQSCSDIRSTSWRGQESGNLQCVMRQFFNQWDYKGRGKAVADGFGMSNTERWTVNIASGFTWSSGTYGGFDVVPGYYHHLDVCLGTVLQWIDNRKMAAHRVERLRAFETSEVEDSFRRRRP